jgi:predicted NAD/FAD-binding protein
MKELLGDKAKLSTPVVSSKKLSDGKYELFTTDNKSLGTFDELVFACHAPTTSKILEGACGASSEVVDLLSKIEYADSVMYVHSDPNLMPKRRRAWTSWNSIGNSELLSVHKMRNSKKAEAMEGGDSGFGNTLANQTKELEGKEGRMKAVYITYWLNRLQNLDTDKDYFVSLNPHEKPDPALTYKRQIMGHPQFNSETMKARKQLMEKYQGKDGLWFCGAWAGHGFHEDGCSKSIIWEVAFLNLLRECQCSHNNFVCQNLDSTSPPK